MTPQEPNILDAVLSGLAVITAGAFGAGLRLLRTENETTIKEALLTVGAGGALAYFLAPYANDLLPEFARKESSLGALSFMIGLGGLALVQRLVDMAPEWFRSRLGLPPNQQRQDDE